jgi:rhodanese-related sulfurtransferase
MTVPSVGVDEIPDDALLLDVREDEEWVAGHIAGATHVPMLGIPQHVQYGALAGEERPLVVVCRSGHRSAQVTAWLRRQGFEAYNLDGGLLEWSAAGKPLVGGTGFSPQVV